MPTESIVSSNVAQNESSQYFIRFCAPDGNAESKIPLKNYQPIYVGRALGCQINFPFESSISRRHCVFQYKNLVVDSLGNSVSGFMIYDLKSSHGTFLNGKRIPNMQNIQLQHGDKIMIGLSKMILIFWDSKKEECNENNLMEKPSSTSQSEETETLSSNWVVKYLKLLRQLSSMANDYEEGRVVLPNGIKSKHFTKKFKQQNKLLLNQVHVVEKLLQVEDTASLNTSSSMKDKLKVFSMPNDETLYPVVVRRKKPKCKVQVENFKLKRKKKDFQKIVKEKLAKEVQKQIQATLSQSHEANSTEEQSQINIPNGEQFSRGIERKRVIKPNKKWDNENFFNPTKANKYIGCSNNAATAPEQSRRGRKPKAFKQVNPLKPFNENKPKRGRPRKKNNLSQDLTQHQEKEEIVSSGSVILSGNSVNNDIRKLISHQPKVLLHKLNDHT